MKSLFFLACWVCVVAYVSPVFSEDVDVADIFNYVRERDQKSFSKAYNNIVSPAYTFYKVELLDENGTAVEEIEKNWKNVRTLKGVPVFLDNLVYLELESLKQKQSSLVNGCQEVYVGEASSNGVSQLGSMAHHLLKSTIRYQSVAEEGQEKHKKNCSDVLCCVCGNNRQLIRDAFAQGRFGSMMKPVAAWGENDFSLFVEKIRGETNASEGFNSLEVEFVEDMEFFLTDFFIAFLFDNEELLKKLLASHEDYINSIDSGAWKECVDTGFLVQQCMLVDFYRYKAMENNLGKITVFDVDVSWPACEKEGVRKSYFCCNDFLYKERSKDFFLECREEGGDFYENVFVMDGNNFLSCCCLGYLFDCLCEHVFAADKRRYPITYSAWKNKKKIFNVDNVKFNKSQNIFSPIEDESDEQREGKIKILIMEENKRLIDLCQGYVSHRTKTIEKTRVPD